jgi:hypothetical protein
LQQFKAEKSLDSTTLDQLAKSLEDLKIAFVKKDDEIRANTRFKDRRCIWCDSTDHGRGDCEEHKEALRQDLIYYDGNRIHSTETRQPLKTNFRKGGMKKILQDERGDRINYSASAGIRLGESCTTQITFWPQVLDSINDNCLMNTKPVVLEVQRSTRWECPVDDTTTHALCQMHEVSVDEKRKRPDESAGPSKEHDTRSTSQQEENKIGVEKGKAKLGPTSQLAVSNIKPQTDMKKLVEERAAQQNEEPPPLQQQQQPPQQKSLEEDHDDSCLSKREQVLPEPTELNSLEQKCTRKEFSEYNEESTHQREGKPGEEGKNLNQKEKKKNKMVKEGAANVVKTNEDTTTEFDSNVKYAFGSQLNKKIDQDPLEVTSMTSRAHSSRI